MTTAAPGAGLPRLTREQHPPGRAPGALGVVVWRFAAPVLAVSSAPLGGGMGERRWILNAQVASSYGRTDPAVHLGEIAEALGLAGPGVGMLTAVDVGGASHCTDGGVRAEASVGLGHPTWAADEDGAGAGAGPAGTVNIVAALPEALCPAALVNAVMTATEAKSQALWEAGVAATGTASDALCLVCPDRAPAHAFGGPRSVWGARLARAVHGAVGAGCRAGTAP
ncbi:MAG TPA: adenosylcobinamide amidohydrolase [Acidimicrobiales bacterium]|nr:adenosylcobinamide amidohydrolase [Acidimicrobiales bacterium]